VAVQHQPLVRRCQTAEDGGVFLGASGGSRAADETDDHRQTQRNLETDAIGTHGDGKPNDQPDDTSMFKRGGFHAVESS
jgi:hypothetical protein